MIVSSGVVPPTELRTVRDITRFCGRRRRSDRSLQLTPQLPKGTKGLTDAVDRYVERAEALLRDGGVPQLPRDLSEVPLVMVPAGVRHGR